MPNLQSFMSGRQKVVVVIVKLNRIATCFAITFLFRYTKKHNVHPSQSIVDGIKAPHFTVQGNQRRLSAHYPFPRLYSVGGWRQEKFPELLSNFDDCN